MQFCYFIFHFSKKMRIIKYLIFDKSEKTNIVTQLIMFIMIKINRKKQSYVVYIILYFFVFMKFCSDNDFIITIR